MASKWRQAWENSPEGIAAKKALIRDTREANELITLSTWVFREKPDGTVPEVIGKWSHKEDSADYCAKKRDAESMGAEGRQMLVNANKAYHYAEYVWKKAHPME